MLSLQENLVGQKPPLRPKDVWAIRIRLQIAARLRDVALFNLASDGKLRGCDLVALRVQRGGARRPRSLPSPLFCSGRQNRPVQFELTDQTRAALESWIKAGQLG